MIAVEQEADARGLTYEKMMENAGNGLAEEINSSFSSKKEAGVLGLIGSGNNGGDTLIALERLSEIGWQVTAYLVGKRVADDPLISRLAASGGSILKLKSDPEYKSLRQAFPNHGIILDGILGTGIKLPLRGKIAQVLGQIQDMVEDIENKPIIIAVDCPSGVDCESGEISPQSLAADMTITMAAVKQGLLKFPANNYIGELRLVGIGLESQEDSYPTWQSINRIVADADWVQNKLPPRPRDAHKGTFGTVMIVAGSVNYTGAALLAGKAAYLSGVGLVEMAIPAPLHSALAGQFPEGIWLLLPHEMGIIVESGAEVVLEGLERTTAMLIGPGLGLEDETECFIDKLLSSSPKSKRPEIGFVAAVNNGVQEKNVELPPLVIDADGLKLLARITEWQSRLTTPAVLTPHPGEMAVLTGLEVSEIQARRLEIAEQFAAEWGHTLVLKGANTIVADPDGKTAVIPIANPALARAGTGDVLAGIIVGLRGQGLAAFEAAVCGCWIHAQSGMKAAQKLGTSTSVLAGDLLSSIPDVFHEME
jgi:NAD(P)H-hydrate epimerase